jgi:4-amino-4-deoxy-L-arabinose transferase-like glycosyltransferase
MLLLAMINKVLKRLTPYFILTVGLSVSMFLMLHRLDNAYIDPWDEIVHVTVVHNLYTDCCDPKLHSIDLGTEVINRITEVANWTNNYIWLHKPLLPFYLRAALYHVFGESLFVFRLPSAVFALLTVVILFLIAKHLSHIWVATGVALLFASNGFVFELVQGRQFSDLSDVLTVFFLTVVLGITLVSGAGYPLFFLKRESSAAYWVASLTAALFSALAYSCKGGLALPALAVFAIALVWHRGWKGIGNIIVMVLFFGALVFVQSFYFSRRFPQEFRYEQLQQIGHLFTDVETWARPWDYYINVYWQRLLGLPLAFSAFLALIASLLPRLRNRRNVLLVVWILIYLVPLSFGVSKLANFLVPVLPAIMLLVGCVGGDLLESERRTFLYPLATIFLVVVILRNHLRLGDSPGTLAESLGHRFLLLGISLGIVFIFAFLTAVGKSLGLAPPPVSPRVAAVTVALMFFTVIIWNFKGNWDMSEALPADYEEQMALKTTADSMKKQISQTAVVLVDGMRVDNAHLYFQYWSGVNSLPAQQLGFAKRMLSGMHPLYILVRDALPDATPIEKLPYGYLYRID